MSDHPPAWRTQLERTLAEIEALGDRIGRRVVETAKDAGHEAKKAWRELEPRIGQARTQVEDQVGRKLRGTADDAVEQLHGMLGELRKSLVSLRDRL